MKLFIMKFKPILIRLITSSSLVWSSLLSKHKKQAKIDQIEIEQSSVFLKWSRQHTRNTQFFSKPACDRLLLRHFPYYPDFRKPEDFLRSFTKKEMVHISKGYSNLNLHLYRTGIQWCQHEFTIMKATSRRRLVIFSVITCIQCSLILSFLNFYLFYLKKINICNIKQKVDR